MSLRPGTPRVRASLLALAASALLACGGGAGGAPSPEARTAEPTVPRSASCPAQLPAPEPLPRMTAAHATLDYWLARSDPGELDRVLMTPAQIVAHDRALTLDPENGLPIDRASLATSPDAGRLRREIETRLAYLREKIESGEYRDPEGQPLSPVARAAFADASPRLEPRVHVALASIPLRCAPRAEPLYKVPVDLAFDRNACSTVRAQEPLQVLAAWPGGMRLARTRYALGWIGPDAALSPALSAEDAARFVTAPTSIARARLALVADDGARLALDDDALLPLEAEGVVLFADHAGLHRAAAAGVAPAARPLTRRAVLEEAFRRVGRPYGWGDHEGGLDCSRFVMDVLGTFGLEIPRHSARQASSGVYTIPLESVTDLGARQRLLDEAARQGVVLLHLPGHVMLYLGRDADGAPAAIHSFSEYVEPCAGEEAETLRRVDRVTVSDLRLGEGTSRRAFLERIDRIVILSQTLGPGLIGVGRPRAAAAVDVPEARACEDSLEVRVFRSPEVPNTRQPLRVFVTAQRELGPATLTLVDPSGARHTPETRRLGGPPFTYWTEIARPAAGRWTITLGDGPNVAACESITVASGPPRREGARPDEVWEPRFRWEDDVEALYSAFIEQLFNFPVEEELTWPNLSVLIDDPAQNILHNHFGAAEDGEYHLEPDCADLPYFLRTYFAWKMRLPFAFRSCTRGRRGALPVCEPELRTPQWPHEESDPVRAFRHFILAEVGRGVHSASGRTHPEDDLTPLYPVPLTRAALRPGTVYADPYGHLLIIAAWVPQGADTYGILLGADAQPDGTVTRRRFWRGSFLFHPDTTNVGAGFKAWRPVLYDRRARTYESLPNAEITQRRGYVPFSMQQYEGTTDTFYETMEGLINPRPLDPVEALGTLIDALEESVLRRIVGVDNGEAWIAANPGRVMEMPEGGAIFQTSGPWEDFATPSRDMRLLVAIDTVVGFADVVRRNPGQFVISEGGLDAAVAEVRRVQASELRRRTFEYRGSHGRMQRLTLADVVERQVGFEVSYNPNDCMELRWAAPPGSGEMDRCSRSAPPEQRARMEEYRSWFHERRRPLY